MNISKLFITLIAFTAFFSLNATEVQGKTLATVNGQAITDSILSDDYDLNLDEHQKANLIEQLVKEEVVYAELLKSELVQEDAFQQAFTQQKKLAEEKYGETLNSEQLRSIKGAVVIALYQQQEYQTIVVDESEASAFYKNNLNNFDFPDSIEIANIIVQDEKLALEITKSLAAAPNLDEAFVQAAKEQNQKGYMGWFGKNNTPENLFNKVYSQTVKTLSDAPVKTKHGYNIVYLLNKRAAGTLTFEEVKEKLFHQLKQQKIMQKIKNMSETLYEKAEIVY